MQYRGSIIMLTASEDEKLLLETLNLGIDQLLMEHYITAETSHPGRMAPNTALSFVLGGATLLVTCRLGRPKQHPINLALLGRSSWRWWRWPSWAP